jgi:hypothetical protein
MDGESQTMTCIQPGDYLISEIVSDGYALTDIDCDGTTATIVIFNSSGAPGGDGFDPGDDTVRFAFDEASDGGTCVFENTEVPAGAGEIVITKTVLGDDDTFTFSVSSTDDCTDSQPDDISGDGEFDLSDGDSETLTCPEAIHTITETVTPGYTLVDIDCTGSSADVTFQPSGNSVFDPGDDTVEIDFDELSDFAACDFVNLDDDLGNIIIIKDAPGGSSSDDFEFVISGDVSCDETFELSDLDFQEFDCAPAFYVVEEVELPDDWAFVDISCEALGEATFEVDADNDPDTNDVEIEIGINPLDAVICIFENESEDVVGGDGNLRIIKEIDNDDDDEDPFNDDDDEESDFDVSGDCDDGSFTLSGDGDDILLDCDFEDGGEITVEEENLPDGFELEDIDCDVNGDEDLVDFEYDVEEDEGGSVTITFEGDADDLEITCTFTNSGDGDGAAADDEGFVVSPITNVARKVVVFPSQPNLDCARSELVHITVSDPRGLPVLDGTRVVITASAGYVSPDVTFTLASAATVHYTAPSTGGASNVTITAAVLGAVGQANIKLNGCGAGAPVSAAAPVRPPSTGQGGSIVPPNTGDAGLAAGSGSTSWTAMVAVSLIGFTLALGGASLIAARRRVD